jgi:3-oxoacyl-[acyl-carrier-protein] synthase-3
MTNQPVSIVDFGSYLPETVVGVDFFLGEQAKNDPMANNPLFRAPATRHHVAPDERAAEMIHKAARPMFDRLGIDPRGNVDVLMTNVLLPDHPITGSGAEAAHLLDCTPEWIIDLHNGGCASFPYMLKLARTIIQSGAARTALICNVQNTAGQIFVQPDIRTRPHAAIPGDGCGVAYVTAGGHSPVLGVTVINAPECAPYLGMSAGDRKYWAPGTKQMEVKFDKSRLAEIIDRGNRMVPDVVGDLCKQIDVSTDEIDVLVTNQPNQLFLRNWREALGLPAERHLNTFDQLGNLYGAGVPVTLERAVRAGEVKSGDLVVFAGFAHAGDFAAAGALRWQASETS